MIEIGRLDIEHEVLVLSSYQAAPHDGHLQHILHIFAFLKKNPKLTLYFDPSPAVIDPTSFTGSTAEAFSNHIEAPRRNFLMMCPKKGRAVEVTAFVDASYASDKKTRRSHKGYILLLNCAPIICYSKRQANVEPCTFGSEFIALKICV